MGKIVLALCVMAWPLSAFAATTFRWDQNTESDLAGYRLYLKNKTTGAFIKLGTDIPKPVTQTTVTVPEPVGADQYSVVMTAFDVAGNESDKSSEATQDGVVYFWKDVTPPGIPQLLQVLQLIADTLQRIAVALESR